jgi:predicted nucleic acid-binding protein
MIVVDASVWVSVFLLRDAHHTISAQWLRSTILTGERLVAPTLLIAEVSGAIARRTGRTDLARRALADMIRLRALQWVEFDIRSTVAAAQLAIDLSLRGADALYVAVAAQLAIPLITWDQEQIARTKATIIARTPNAPA